MNKTIKELETEIAMLTNSVKMYEIKVAKLRRTISNDMNREMNSICIPKCYLIDEDNKEIYDFEIMKMMFEEELQELIKKVYR
jgi:hypothetical protein|tara:strand:+ start:103 stop:351 length:249 start_codon:yes stop_codon:yes gene_type:complete